MSNPVSLHRGIKRGAAWLLAAAMLLCLLPVPLNAQAAGNSDRIIVSLGDSYSSGEGIEPFFGQEKDLADKVQDPDWLAHRSMLAWSGMLTLPSVSGTMSDHRNTHWYFAAVSGATTEHMNNPQPKPYNRSGYSGSVDLAPQLSVFDQLGGRKADYVTLTLGGNDADFTGVIEKVAKSTTYLNFSRLEDDINLTWQKFFAKGGIRDDLKQAYRDISAKAGPQAHIIVAGYPQLLDPGAGGILISLNEATVVNEAVSKFNDEIEKLIEECRGEGMSISFVSVEKAFAGHEAYSDDPYLNKVILLKQDQDLEQKGVGSAYSMHPNYAGACAYAQCVQAEIDRLEAERTPEQQPDSPGQESTQWAQAYYDFIVEEVEQMDLFDDYDWIDYYLCNIDDDGIPELWISYPITAAGCRICTYSGNELVTQIMSLSSLHYLEGENRFMCSGGRQGYYFDLVMTIENGEFSVVADGTYQEQTDENGPVRDENGNYVYLYQWDGQEVTLEEYTAIRNRWIDPERADRTDWGNETVKSYTYDEILELLSAIAGTKSDTPGNAPYLGDLSQWTMSDAQANAYAGVLEDALDRFNSDSRYDYTDGRSVFATFIDADGRTLLWLAGVTFSNYEGFMPKDIAFGSGSMRIAFEEIWEWDGKKAVPMDILQGSTLTHANYYPQGFEIFTYYGGTDVDGEAWRAFYPVEGGTIGTTPQWTYAWAWVYSYKLEDLDVTGLDQKQTAQVLLQSMMDSGEWPELTFDWNTMTIPYAYSGGDFRAEVTGGTGFEAFCAENGNEYGYWPEGADKALQRAARIASQDGTWQEAGSVIALLRGFNSTDRSGWRMPTSLSAQTLGQVKTRLNIPEDLQVDVVEGELSFWTAGNRFEIYVAFYSGDKLIASASVDPRTGETLRNISRYSGS